MAGVTSGLGGGVAGDDDPRQVGGSLSDLTLFSQDNSDLMDNFGFVQFFQIFFLGVFRLLLSFCPGTTFGLLSNDDSILPDTREERAFLGDPLKNTMLMTVMRRLPILTTIPVILSIVLFVIDMIMLINPMTHNRSKGVTSLAPMPHSEHPKTPLPQEQEDIGERREVRTAREEGTSCWVQCRFGFQGKDEAGAPLEQWSDGLEHYEEDEDEDMRAGKETLQEYNVAPYTKIEVLVRETIGSFADILPQLGACLGTIIGGHIRFWGSPNFPFGTMVTCAGLVGRSISHLLAVLGRNEIIYPI